jgi:hypothetical protein
MPSRPKNPNRQKLADRQWVEEELGSLDLGDVRRARRVKKMLGDMGAQPGASLPRASGDWRGTKAAYRCLSHEEMEAEELFGAHRVAVVARAGRESVVLAVQDTTTLNFSTHPQTKGLGPVSNNRDQTIGLLLHSTLVLREDGQALGLLARWLHARDPKQFKAGPAGARNRQPVTDKESHKWLLSLEATVAAAAAQGSAQTQWINIADREADSYDLFWRLVELRAAEDTRAAAQRVELLVRSQHNRALDAETERLFAHLAAQEIIGHYRFTVPRQPGKKSREATLSIRVAEVRIPPPPDQVKYHGRTEPLALWAIEAVEDHPAAGAAPICWRLLSTLPVRAAATAVLQVRRYSQRWEIEIFHKTLKSGCRAEDRQLETAERLGRCLMLDMLVAWRVLALSKAGRGAHAAPPVADWLEEAEWKALWCYIHQRTDPPETPPSTLQAMRWIAQLGGFLGRRSDGFPGPMTLWQGLQRLHDFTHAYLLFAPTQKDVGNA